MKSEKSIKEELEWYLTGTKKAVSYNAGYRDALKWVLRVQKK